MMDERHLFFTVLMSETRKNLGGEMGRIGNGQLGLFSRLRKRADLRSLKEAGNGLRAGWQVVERGGGI